MGLLATYLETFLATRLDTFPVFPVEPALHSFRQHRLYLLELRLLGQRRHPEPPGHHPPNPLPERSLQLRIARTAQPSGQRVHRLSQLLHRAAALQPHDRRHQVATRQILFAPSPLVKHEVALRRLVSPQPLPHRRDQPRHLGPGPPPRLAVVEHDGQYRRQSAVRVQRLLAEQVLVQQPRVDQDAQRHVGVIRRLELQQHQHVQPLVAQPHPPYSIALAPAEIVAHELRGQLLQGVEVESRDPVLGDEPAQEVRDHPGVGEQGLVGGVGHPPTVMHGRGPHSRRRSRRTWGIEAVLRRTRATRGIGPYARILPPASRTGRASRRRLIP